MKKPHVYIKTMFNKSFFDPFLGNSLISREGKKIDTWFVIRLLKVATNHKNGEPRKRYISLC